MAIEIEKKYRLDKNLFERVSDDLKKLRADFIGEDFEENYLFSGGIVTRKEAVLRIRKIGEKTLLTYKERIGKKSEINHHTEFETEIKDAEQLEKIIESLGFEKTLVYEKRRKTWEFGNVEIVLDELPFGFFMEIEGSVSEIEETENLLNASEFEAEQESYPLLTAKLGRRNGHLIEARFAV